MTGDSYYQRLPLDIWAGVLSFIPLRQYALRALQRAVRPPPVRTDLLPYMQVCRLWRQAVCPVFYRSALVLNGHMDGAFGEHEEDMLYLSQVISNAQQHYLHDIAFYVNLFDIECLDDDGIRQATSVLRSAGQLPGIRSIALKFIRSDTAGKGSPEDKQSTADDQIRKVCLYLSTLVESIRATLPQVCQVVLNGGGLFIAPPSQHFAGMPALRCASMLVDDKTTCLSLLHISAMDVVTSYPPLPSQPSLQTLDLENRASYPMAVRLVERCAESLVKLRIGPMSGRQALELTWSGDYKAGQTRVYPNLKHLDMVCNKLPLGSPCPQPQVDPFPELGVLICRGEFPYSIPVVLGGARSHVHHLELNLDHDLYNRLVDGGILAKGAFSSLRYVSLKWRHAVAGQEDVLAQHALQLCRTIQTVCLSYSWSLTVDTTIHLLPSLHNLHTLDIAGARLSLDDAMVILCACPCLQKANIQLNAVSAPFTGKTLTASTVNAFKEKYSGYTSTVSYLGICSISFPEFIAAECVVLLAYLLESVAQVSIRPYAGKTYTRTLLHVLEGATLMSVFDDRPHIRSVKFVLDPSW